MDLKQAPRVWFQQLISFLLTNYFIAVCPMPLFIRHGKHTSIFVLIYGDDIIFTSHKASENSLFIDLLCFIFHSRRMGYHSYFLGMYSTELPPLYLS